MIPIDITKEDFERHIHAAAHCDDTIYNAVAPYMDKAWGDVQRILLDTGEEAMYADANMQETVKELVCERGFLLALRHLDLVITDSGFGVVSNDHVAPASAERVSNLEQALWKAADMAMCNLLHLLVETKEWGKEPAARYFINTLLWDREETMRLCGKADLSHKEWVALQTQVFDAEFSLSFALSDSLMQELLLHMITDSLSDIEKLAVQVIRTGVGNIVANFQDKGILKATKLRLINWFDSHKEEFPAYTSSSEYKARHQERYENTKNSTAYFFG